MKYMLMPTRLARLAASALCTAGLLIVPAMAAHETNQPSKGTDDQITRPLSFEPEMLERMFEAAGKSQTRMLEMFCTRVRDSSTEDFERFVHRIFEDYYELTGYGWYIRLKTDRFRAFFVHERGFSAALHCLDQGGRQVSPQTAFNLSEIILGSVNERPEGPSGYKWLVQAARGGHPLAQYILSAIIASKNYGPGNSPPQFGDRQVPFLAVHEEISLSNYYRWLRRAAVAGVPIAQYRLGELLVSSNSKGRREALMAQVAIDPREGIEWLEKAARSAESSPYPPDLVANVRRWASQTLGWAYSGGEVVPQDFVKALFWVHQVEDEFLSQSTCSMLARMYREGLGTPRDDKKAEFYNYCGRPIADPVFRSVERPTN